MFGGILVVCVTGVFAFIIANSLKRRYQYLDDRFLKGLFFYHILLSTAYYLYVMFNPSDSKAYFNTSLNAENWFALYGSSTTFIRFLAFPFVKLLGFSYEATMALFSFVGYLGIVYLYVLFRENLRFKHAIFGVDLLKLLFLLPNVHFWSSSLGKGSVILLGIGLFFFGINRLNKRYVAVLIGALLIYHVRPHIMLVVLVSSAIGFAFSTKDFTFAMRFAFVAAATLAFFLIYKDVLTLVGIDEDTFVTQGLDLTHRATELSKATSGVDLTGYSLPMKVFTFLYRPLFIDAPGPLGLIVSIENFLCLLITLRIFNWTGLQFLLSSSFIVKTAFLSFISVTIALAQISANLGLAMRQKSQIMILFLFVIIVFLDHQKMLKWKMIQKRKIEIANRTKLRVENAN